MSVEKKLAQKNSTIKADVGAIKADVGGIRNGYKPAHQLL